MTDLQPAPNAKTRLLNSALKLIRTKGYDATTVDELCKDAGVTKGAFFHHFKTKEVLGVESTRYWNTMTGALFAQAPYHLPADPLDKLLAYIDFRSTLIAGDVPEFTCLLGTMVQETFESSDVLREACDIGISSHAATLEGYIVEAMREHCVTGFTPQSLALYTQAALQGAFILAKARNDADVARDMISHLKRYVELLFKTGGKQ
jgi:TetR/AcrR family transcriptional regulator, transcriptional repressor for nem operon